MKVNQNFNLNFFWGGHLLVLSYAKNFGIRKAVSSGNLEELGIIWQLQIKDSVKSYIDLFSLLFQLFYLHLNLGNILTNKFWSPEQWLGTTVLGHVKKYLLTLESGAYR